jgi:Mlc titration factor MtfA (ptsG expression regulator)
MLFQFFVLLLFGAFFLVVIIFRIIEPVYMMIFNKPLYLYFYLFPKKLTTNQKQILINEFPFYKKLSDRKKIYFEHRVKEFINHYQFVGKEELLVTDEMKVVIAGTYTMLTFGMRDYLIDLFKTIIIYPSVYFSTSSQEYHKGEFNPIMKVVAFSWEDFALGHRTVNDNLNLGLHEFSHVLHFYCLRSNNPSAIIFFDEFNKVVKYYNDENLNKQLSNNGYFRDYAYENQFEFISVVLEHFFETPQVFKTQYPELFQHISSMINFDENNFVN